MPPTTTRTLNPLPFDQLEPKRFEDLVRQLAYDFKPWRQLEATGRAGSDDGFDARGFEIVPTLQGSTEDDEDSTDSAVTDRLWLVQCKRERAIGPTKIAGYLAGIPAGSLDGLYGMIFAAACDFSKKTRDAYRTWCAARGIQECHIWGKAEIEDMLFQPKNDNLLFAYFGISIQIRKQRTAVNIRRNTTVKRKLKRILEDGSYSHLAIIRDISDTRYPYADDLELESTDYLWRVCHIVELGIGGLRVLMRKHYAYYDHQHQKWDLATGSDTAFVNDYENPWRNSENKSPKLKERDTVAHEFWLSLPDKYRAEVSFMAEIPYSEILDIDDIGDVVSQLPTIYVVFREGKIPVSDDWHVVIEENRMHGEQHRLHKGGHVRVFPEGARDLEWESDWAARNGVSLEKTRTDVELTPPKWLVELQEHRRNSANPET